MKAYDRYKDSGVEWIGEIPEHWNSIKMKYLFKDTSIKNQPHLPLLSVTQDKGVVPRNMVETRMVMPTGNLESFKVINQGDFAISLRSFEGGLEYSEYDGIISPAYTVLKTKKVIHDKYFKYLFKSYAFIAELQLSIVGIREGKNISYEELKYSLLPIPPLAEQQKIAEFLDHKTELIDKAIAIKEKQIALLKERKQVLIQDLVTGKKIWDGKAWVKPEKTKDSGIDWIGEIPVDWEVRKLKYCLKIRNEKEDSKISSKIYVGMENIESKTGQYIPTKSDVEGLANKFYENDILFGKLRPYLAKVHLCKFEGICSTEFLVLFGLNTEYFQKLLICSSFIDLVDSSTYGAKMPRANAEFISNIIIPIPSSMSMHLIVDYIENIEDNIQRGISLKRQEIEKLKEYKTSLINEVVTGKVKVF